MKRTTKQLLSMLLAILMVIGLMAPAMAARPMGDVAAETPAGSASRPSGSGKTMREILEEGKAELNADPAVHMFNVDSNLPADTATITADGVTELDGGYFKVHWGERGGSTSKVDKNDKVFSEAAAVGVVTGVNELSPTNRIKTDTAAKGFYISFKPTRPAVVEMWVDANGKKLGLATTHTATEAGEGVIVAPTAAVPGGPTYLVYNLPVSTSTDGWCLFNADGNMSVFQIKVTEMDSLTPDLDAVKTALDAKAATALTVNSAIAKGKEAATAANLLRTLIKNTDVLVDIIPASSGNVDVVDGTLADNNGTAGLYKFTAKLTTADNTTGVTTAEFTMNVTQKKYNPVVSCTVSAADTKVVVEETLQLSATVSGGKDNDNKDITPTDNTVTWSVADEDKQYLTVDADGKVTGVKATPSGTKVTVTATANGGNNVKGTIDLTVVEAGAEEEKSYVYYELDGNTDFTEAIGQGSLTAGNTKKVGTDGYFIINGGPKIQVMTGQNAKTYEDEYKATTRIRPGTTHVKTTDTTAEGYYKNNNVQINTSAPATVKIWWYSDNNTAARYVAIWDEEGNQIGKTKDNVADANDKAPANIDEISIPKAGTYYFVCPNNGCTISKIVVGEEVEVGYVDYELDGNTDFTEAIGQGSLTAGNTKKVGTDGFFIINGGPKIQVMTGQNAKTYEDEYKATTRIRPGTTHVKTTDTTAEGYYKNNNIQINLDGAAKVKIWWYSDNNTAARYVAIWDEEGNQIGKTKDNVADANDKAPANIDEISIPKAGTYYFVCPNNGCTISKIVVSVATPVTHPEYLLDGNTDFTEAIGQGSLTAGNTKKVGTDGYFIINGGPKIQVMTGQNAKTYEDEYKATTRIRPGTTHVKTTDTTAEGYYKNNNIQINTEGAATVTIWWYSDNNTAARYVAIWDEEGNQIGKTKDNVADANDKAPANIDEISIPKAGTYYFVCPNNGCTISKIVVVDTAAGGKKTKVLADWETVVVKDAAVATAVDGGTLTATVSGILVGEGKAANNKIPVYADEIVAKLYAGTTATGEPVDSVTSNKEMLAAEDTQDIEFTPDATGKYVITVTATRAEDSKTKTVTSSVVEFTLPLKVPAIEAVAATGNVAADKTVSVNVSWTAVPEATSYNLYVKEVADDATTADFTGVTAISVDAGDSTNIKYEVTGLTSGTNYAFALEAVRKADTLGGVTVTATTTAKSAVKTAVATGTKQIPWTWKVFGTSSTVKDNVNEVVVGDYLVDSKIIASDPDNKPGTGDETYFPGANVYEEIKGLTGDPNTDPEGRVLLSSKDGAGKITEPSGSDGLLAYYTPVPAGYNFSLSAKVHVTRWQTRDTQNGLGLLALDRVPAESWTGSSGSNGGDFWNNSYMAGAARLSFSWDGKNGKAYAKGTGLNGDPGADNYTGYSYYMGLLSIAKHGTPAGYDAAGTVASTYRTRRFPLDTRLCEDGISVKYNNNTNRFNTIGNYIKLPAGVSSMAEGGDFMEKYELTDFYLELKKTPTGYVSTAWAVNKDGKKGDLLGTNTEYYSKGAAELSGGNPYVHYADAVGADRAKDQSGYAELGLTNFDPDFEYVGFFTSRDTDALFSDIQFDMWPQAEDKTPVETPPITTVTPTLSISSGSTANTEKFTLSIASNVDGFVTIQQNGNVIATDVPIKADVRLDYQVTLVTGTNGFTVTMNVDPDMELPAYTILDPTVTSKQATSSVMFRRSFENLNNLYVAPYGRDTGRATKASPLDIYTAVSVVRPGQNIILMDGEYKLTKTIRIPRGMNGVDGKVTKQVTRIDEETGESVTEEVQVDGRIFMLADPEAEKVVLNGQRSIGSILSTGGNYWVFKDFEVVGSSGGATAVIISGNHNLVQGLKIHDNGGTGLLIGRMSASDKYPVRETPETVLGADADWGEWPCYNTILNCDSFRNYDMGYNGADGFAAKETAGWGNVFDGCASFWNADDGWDLFAKSEIDKGCLGVVTLKNCITYGNGFEVRKITNPTTQTPEYQAGSNYLPVLLREEDGQVKLGDCEGNGNGFKMGGNHLPGAHEISNSYAFYNKAKGFDSNNGPDIHVTDCTGYNNGEENVGLSSNATLAYVVANVVSFKDGKSLPSVDKTHTQMADAIKEGAGNQIDTATYYKWTGDNGKSTNGTTEITAANFESLKFDNTKWENGAPRKADGSLDLGDFLKLKNVSNAGAGDLVNDTTPVEDPDLVVDPPVEGNTSKPSAAGGGGGGSMSADTSKPADTTEPSVPAVDPEKDFNATRKTDAEGNKEIVVKDKDGEVVADVVIPAKASASPFRFIDVPDEHWAADSINNMAAQGIVKGVSMNEETNEGVYDMDSSVTRGTIATMLFRFAQGKDGKANVFSDVADGVWYTDGIAWAASTGVVNGYGDGTFGPDDTITREQLAIMLMRFAKLIGLDTTVKGNALAGYNDADGVSTWAADAMGWAVSNGIINGISADTLSPNTTATRAQVAVMLDRFIALI